jgi:hypothetical protein
MIPARIRFLHIEHCQALESSKFEQTGGTQNRPELRSSLVQEYALALKSGVELPPVRLWFDGHDYWMSDGFHRLKAAQLCKAQNIPAEVHQGSRDDARWDSYSANAHHGLRRTTRELLGIVERALQHPNARCLSNVELAKHLGVPEPTLRRWRKRLSPLTDERAVRTVNRNGST